MPVGRRKAAWEVQRQLRAGGGLDGGCLGAVVKKSSTSPRIVQQASALTVCFAQTSAIGWNDTSRNTEAADSL